MYYYFCAIFVVATCDLICDRSTKQYPLNGKNRLHILNNREAYYYYYYYYHHNIYRISGVTVDIYFTRTLQVTLIPASTGEPV